MEVRSTTLRVKKEGERGLALYIPKAVAQNLGIKAGDEYALIFSKDDPSQAILSKNITFNPMVILKQLWENAETTATTTNNQTFKWFERIVGNGIINCI